MKYFKSLITTFVLGAICAFANEPLQPYQIFLASLSHRATQSQLKYLSTQNFDENKLLRLLVASGLEVSSPKLGEKNSKWKSFKIKFLSTHSLSDAHLLFETIANKMDNHELGPMDTGYSIERHLARALLERDLLSHLLQSSEYRNFEDGRKKLSSFNSN